MSEVKKEKNNKIYITIIMEIVLIISFMAILINLIERDGQYDVPFVSDYARIYVYISLFINLFLIVYVYRTKNRKNIFKINLISIFLIVLFLIPTYSEYKLEIVGTEFASYGKFVKISRNIFGINLGTYEL